MLAGLGDHTGAHELIAEQAALLREVGDAGMLDELTHPRALHPSRSARLNPHGWSYRQAQRRHRPRRPVRPTGGDSFRDVPHKVIYRTYALYKETGDVWPGTTFMATAVAVHIGRKTGDRTLVAKALKMSEAVSDQLFDEGDISTKGYTFGTPESWFVDDVTRPTSELARSGNSSTRSTPSRGDRRKPQGTVVGSSERRRHAVRGRGLVSSPTGRPRAAALRGGRVRGQFVA
jgi:hypothetical protein